MRKTEYKVKDTTTPMVVESRKEVIFLLDGTIHAEPSTNLCAGEKHGVPMEILNARSTTYRTNRTFMQPRMVADGLWVGPAVFGMLLFLILILR